jgi:hypothetical protein
VGLLSAVAVLITSGCVFLNFAEGLENNHHALLIDMVYHRAYRPFVARTLLPTAIRAIAAAVPAPLERVSRGSSEESTPDVSTQTPAGERRSGLSAMKRLLARYPVETIVALGLMYGSLLGFVYLASLLFSIFYQSPPVVDLLIPAVAPLGIPLFYFPGKWSYPYDLPALFLTTACLFFLARGRWTAYLLSFTLACLNKETAVLLTLVFYLVNRLERRLDPSRLLSLTAAQLGIFALIKVGFGVMFRDNPGPYMEFHLFDHNLWSALEWLRSGYGLEGLVAVSLATFCIVHNWSDKPLLFRCGLVLIPPMLLLGFLFGWFEEWRQYLECYPILLMLILGTVAKAFGTRRRADRTSAQPAH